MLKPNWGTADESECRSKQPPKGISYLDVVYVISPVSLSAMQSDGSVAVASVLSSYLSVNTNSVDVWKIKDVTDTYQSEEMGTKEKMAVWVRVTVNDDVASNVLVALGASISRLVSDLATYYTSIFTSDLSIAFMKEPELSQYKGRGGVSAGLVVVLVIVVLIVAAIAAFYIWTRMKNKGKKNGAKRLARAGAKGGKNSKNVRV